MAARPALYTAQRRAPFRLTLKGSPSLAEPLGAALWAQWSYGFPIVPRQHGPQLTHGFLQYPAGMQPLAAQQLLVLVLLPGVCVRERTAAHVPSTQWGTFSC